LSLHSASPITFGDKNAADVALSILDRQSSGVVIVNKQLEVIFWNNWVAAWSGISADHAIGKNFAGLFPDLVSTDFLVAVDNAIYDNRKAQWSLEVDPERLDIVESGMTPGDGEQPLCQVNFSSIPLQQKGPGCLLEFYVAALNPTVSRRHYQASPNARQEIAISRFPVYLESEDLAVLLIDSDGLIQDVNSRTASMTAYAREQLVGKPLRILFPDLADIDEGEDYQEFIATSQRQRRGGVIEAVTADGLTVQFVVATYRVVAQGNLLMLACRDATRAVGGQDALQRQRELLSAIFGHVADGIILTDRTGVIEQINTVGMEMLQLRPGQGVGRPVDDVLRLTDSGGQKVPSPCREVLQRGAVYSTPDDIHLAVGDDDGVQVMVTAVPLRDGKNSLTGCMLVFRTVSEARQVSTRLTWQASHDPLTQLANRRQLDSDIAEAINDAHSAARTHYLLYVDLYNFAIVNDTCGQAAGDELLRQFGRLLSRLAATDDVVARTGNDEFAVLLWDHDADAARDFAEQLLFQVKAFSFPWEERRLKIGVSIGASAIGRNTGSEIDVLVAAASSCARARESGRNRIVFPSSREEPGRHKNITQWIPRITEALEEDRFCLYCQPIVPLKATNDNGKHYEVLVRMLDKKGQIIAPGQFVPAAEQYGLIDDIDRWVFNKVLDTLQKINRGQREGLRLSVNLSGSTIGDEKFCDYLLARFEESGVDPRHVQFEITETAAIRQFDRALDLIRRLKAKGCYFSLDDFGSGLSSFGYLKQLPVDYLKIDGSFVRKMELNDVDYSMVSTINHLAHIMGISTIAECVENQIQLSMLEEMGVDCAQGFVVAMPQPLENIFS